MWGSVEPRWGKRVAMLKRPDLPLPSGFNVVVYRGQHRLSDQSAASKLWCTVFWYLLIIASVRFFNTLYYSSSFVGLDRTDYHLLPINLVLHCKTAHLDLFYFALHWLIDMSLIINWLRCWFTVFHHVFNGFVIIIITSIHTFNFLTIIIVITGVFVTVSLMHTTSFQSLHYLLFLSFLYSCPWMLMSVLQSTWWPYHSYANIILASICTDHYLFCNVWTYINIHTGKW